MNELQTVLLKVWREACRHIEIGRSADNIAALLLQWLPLDHIWIRRFDRGRCGFETVAVGLKQPNAALPDGFSPGTPEQLAAFSAWCARGAVERGNRQSLADGKLGFLVPAGIEGEILAGPLGKANEPTGILLLTAAVNCTFEERHLALAERLLEPFSIALENDQRLREMAALREAAEADRRSLLARLGRKQIGDTVVGAESGLRSVMERVELVAPSDAPVLILGETGTGKELVARAIHSRSHRSSGPFDRVNCGAIPPELIDSQLFGHERGAFTGAVESRRGWFERANGGTLFLDEIGDLPLPAQVRMLRILQDGWMERVGGEQSIHVNVRIVAATHRDLAAMVAEGRFREDLWYRIAVFPIVLPTLRERREDIPRLVEHFAARAATRFGLAPVKPTTVDLELLASYPWPGNIRELGTVIDRAAILGDGKTLEVAKALGVGTRHALAIPDASPRSAGIAPPAEMDLEPLNAVVRRHIEAALAAAKGRIEGPFGAANAMQINPHTLRAKMRKLGVDWKTFRSPKE
ncbi:MAG: sigma-54-dependent Fis family transcriptional regulator [Pirellulales bacterium]|nr:sigma-54-dependent Fis family transcriptional regulator [Pirellulales bacterium]